MSASAPVKRYFSVLVLRVSPSSSPPSGPAIQRGAAPGQFLMLRCADLQAPVDSPAHPGDTIVLWGTGGGADAQNDNGGSAGDQTAAGNFIVTAGTRQITPFYAGTSSGYPGLFQINFRLPADIAIDCFTTISVTASGEASNTVVIPIAAAGQTSCTDPTMPASVLSKLDSGANIYFGGLVITRVTEALAGITSETAIGAVFSYTPAEWTILNSGPTFGACRLYDRTYPQGGKDPRAFFNEPDEYADRMRRPTRSERI